MRKYSSIILSCTALPALVFSACGGDADSGLTNAAGKSASDGVPQGRGGASFGSGGASFGSGGASFGSGGASFGNGGAGIAGNGAGGRSSGGAVGAGDAAGVGGVDDAGGKGPGTGPMDGGGRLGMPGKGEAGAPGMSGDGTDAGGTSGADTECPGSAPNSGDACASDLNCTYAETKCRCSGPKGNAHWDCMQPPQQCPEKAPAAGSKCTPGPAKCSYSGDVTCTCGDNGWQCAAP